MVQHLNLWFVFHRTQNAAFLIFIVYRKYAILDRIYTLLWWQFLLNKRIKLFAFITCFAGLKKKEKIHMKEPV